MTSSTTIRKKEKFKALIKALTTKRFNGAFTGNGNYYLLKKKGAKILGNQGGVIHRFVRNGGVIIVRRVRSLVGCD